MRNTLLKKYFSYFIILINNKLSKNNENMRNEFDKFGSSSNLVVIYPVGGISIPLLRGGCVKSKNQVFFDILYKKDFISLLC